MSNAVKFRRPKRPCLQGTASRKRRVPLTWNAVSSPCEWNHISIQRTLDTFEDPLLYRTASRRSGVLFISKAVTWITNKTASPLYRVSTAPLFIEFHDTEFTYIGQHNYEFSAVCTCLLKITGFQWRRQMSVHFSHTYKDVYFEWSRSLYDICVRRKHCLIKLIVWLN